MDEQALRASTVFTCNTSVMYGADIWVDDMEKVEGWGGKVILQVVPRVQVKMSIFFSFADNPPAVN